jgi:hypothetical protein
MLLPQAAALNPFWPEVAASLRRAATRTPETEILKLSTQLSLILHYPFSSHFLTILPIIPVFY